MTLLERCCKNCTLFFHNMTFLENHAQENERAHLQSGSTVKYWLNFFLSCFYRSLYKLYCCYRLIIMKDHFLLPVPYLHKHRPVLWNLQPTIYNQFTRIIPCKVTGHLCLVSSQYPHFLSEHHWTTVTLILEITLSVVKSQSLLLSLWFRAPLSCPGKLPGNQRGKKQP